MAELKTKLNDGNVEDFLNGVENSERRSDAFKVLAIMERISGFKGKMWGNSIVGFGNYKYKYANGKDAEWMLTGFSPRKQNMTLYIMNGFEEYESLLDKLGKYSTGKSCLYLKRLDDVEPKVLEELIEKSIKDLKDR